MLLRTRLDFFRIFSLCLSYNGFSLFTSSLSVALPLFASNIGNFKSIDWFPTKIENLNYPIRIRQNFVSGNRISSYAEYALPEQRFCVGTGTLRLIIFGWSHTLFILHLVIDDLFTIMREILFWYWLVPLCLIGMVATGKFFHGVHLLSCQHYRTNHDVSL